MKYMIVLLALLSGCATTKPRTTDDCMRILREKMEEADPSKLSEADESSLSIGLYVVCNQAKNDPCEAARILERIRYSH